MRRFRQARINEMFAFMRATSAKIWERPPNGVINVQFDLSGANQGGTQVVVFGTAVVIQPVKNYVPTGAMGNIVAEIADHITKQNP